MDDGVECQSISPTGVEVFHIHTRIAALRKHDFIQENESFIKSKEKSTHSTYTHLHTFIIHFSSNLTPTFLHSSPPSFPLLTSLLPSLPNSPPCLPSSPFCPLPSSFPPSFLFLSSSLLPSLPPSPSSLPLTPQEQSLLGRLHLRRLILQLDVLNLKPQDDGPDQPQNQTGVTIHNVLRTNVLKVHLQQQSDTNQANAV